MNNTTITLATVSAENKTEFLEVVGKIMSTLDLLAPSTAMTFRDEKPEFSKRFQNAYNVLKESIGNFNVALEKGEADMEEMKELSWNIITSVAAVQEGFCDAAYYGHKNIVGHKLADSIEQLFAIAHDDAAHLVRDGEKEVYRIWNETQGKLLETNDREAFIRGCKAHGVDDYQDVLNNYDKNGGKPAFLNIPIVVVETKPAA